MDTLFGIKDVDRRFHEEELVTTKVKWEEMFPEELYEKIQEEPVCYMAYGLAEPHGVYNALGLDWLKAQALVDLSRIKRGEDGLQLEQQVPEKLGTWFATTTQAPPDPPGRGGPLTFPAHRRRGGSQ